MGYATDASPCWSQEQARPYLLPTTHHPPPTTHHPPPTTHHLQAMQLAKEGSQCAFTLETTGAQRDTPCVQGMRFCSEPRSIRSLALALALALTLALTLTLTLTLTP